jgi:hypothetical protein
MLLIVASSLYPMGFSLEELSLSSKAFQSFLSPTSTLLPNKYLTAFYPKHSNNH